MDSWVVCTAIDFDKWIRDAQPPLNPELEGEIFSSVGLLIMMYKRQKVHSAHQSQAEAYLDHSSTFCKQPLHLLFRGIQSQLSATLTNWTGDYDLLGSVKGKKYMGILWVYLHKSQDTPTLLTSLLPKEGKWWRTLVCAQMNEILKCPSQKGKTRNRVQSLFYQKSRDTHEDQTTLVNRDCWIISSLGSSVRHKLQWVFFLNVVSHVGPLKSHILVIALSEPV